MPQMFPMSWLIIYVSVFILYYSMMSVLYYMSGLSSVNMSVKEETFLFYWKW